MNSIGIERLYKRSNRSASESSNRHIRRLQLSWHVGKLACALSVAAPNGGEREAITLLFGAYRSIGYRRQRLQNEAF